VDDDVTVSHSPAAAGSDGGAAPTLATAPPPTAKRRPRLLHRILIGVMIALSCLTLILSGVALWVHYTVLDTDGYLAVVGPLGKDPKVIAAVSDYVGAQVVAATDLQARVENVLPPRLDVLAVPVTAAVDEFITKQTNRILSTPQAYNLWIEINRQAHTRIVALLRGESTYGYIAGDAVKLNTLPLISEVLVAVDSKLPGWLSSRFNPPVIPPDMPVAEASQQLSAWLGRPLPADAGQVTLLTSEALGPAQQAVKWLDRLVIILPVVTLILFAVTILVSRQRRRTIIELGIGIAVSLIVLRVVLVRLQAAVIVRLQENSLSEVVGGVVTASLGPLLDIIVWVVVGAVIVAVVAWLVGRADVRRAVVTTSQGVIAAGGEAMRGSSAPTMGWIETHTDLVRILALAVGAVLLLLFSSSWPWLVVWLVLIVAAQAAISWLAREWPFSASE
jgi:hypothetical protein